ncbi:hypothetical protein AB0B30_32460 [Streptomyces narbonensis]|uniref:Uncharacterized protein n=1 Tax=Streptomyces narbonensis TaxID=67333 RepID=A0ABV3CIY5_9ACTN
MAANQAEVDLVVNAAGALPDLERQLSQIIRVAENEADAIDVPVAIDARDAARTLSIQLERAIEGAEGQVDGIEVGALINQRDALRTLDRQLSDVIQSANRGHVIDDRLLVQAVIDAPESIRNMGTELQRVVANIQADAPDVEIDVDVDEDVNRDVGRLRDSLSGLGTSALTAAKGIGGVAKSATVMGVAVGAGVNVVAGLVAALQQVAPAAAVATQAMLAQRLAAGTLQLAMIGVEDAIQRAFDPELSPEEFHKSLKGLAPEARLFVDQIHTMRRELRALQQGVQNRVFKDLDEALVALGTSTLPVVRGALNRTADSLNQMAKGVTESALLLSESGVLGQALDGATQGLENLEKVPGRLATSFGLLAAASAPAFDRITLAIDGLSLSVAEKLNRAFESGALEESINKSIDTIKQLGSTLGNFASGVGNIFSGLTQNGGGLFDILEKISLAFEDLTASSEFQSILNELSLTAGVLVESILPLIKEAFVQLTPVIEELAPVIRDFVTAIGPELIPIIQELGPILVDIAIILREQLPFAIEFTKASLEALGFVLNLIHGLLQNVIIPIVREVADVLDSEFIHTIRDLSSTLGNDLPAAAGLFEVMRSRVVDQIQAIAVAITSFILDLKSDVLGGITGFVNDAVGAFNDLTNRVSQAFSDLVGAIGRLIDDAIGRIRELPGAVAGAFSALAGDMYALGANAVGGFISGLTSGIGEVLSAARAIANSVTSTIAGALDIRSPSRKTRKQGRDTGKGLALGLKDSTSTVKKAAEDLAGVVVSSATAELSRPITTFFEEFKDQAGRAVGEVLNAGTLSVAAPITKFFDDLKDQVGRTLGEVLNAGTVDVADPITRFFEDMQDQVGRAVGEVLNGGRIDALPSPGLGGVPVTPLPTFQNDGTVVNVFMDGKLIHQVVDRRVQVATNQQARRNVFGVRI